MAEKRAWTMVMPVIQRLQDMAKEETAKGDEQLDNALKKLVRPAHDIDKRPESSPDFNPLGINKKNRLSSNLKTMRRVGSARA